MPWKTSTTKGLQETIMDFINYSRVKFQFGSGCVDVSNSENYCVKDICAILGPTISQVSKVMKKFLESFGFRTEYLSLSKIF